MIKSILFTILLITALTFILRINAVSQIRLDTPNIDSQLYLGNSSNQPLIVGLGGSEGGNAWASNYWKNIREEFIRKGYAFLAIGYFGSKNTPKILNKISINAVHNAIMIAAKNSKINKKKIAIIGGSRGGDLALLIGSYYKDIKCVVAIVPSHVVFPGHTTEFTTSAWTYNDLELPFVPVSEAAVPSLLNRDLRSAFEIMLQDKKAEEKALIKVEKINGPILFLSATKDEIVPTTPMCEKMMTRLKEKRFKNHFQHLSINGSHTEPLKHFDKVFNFFEMYFLS